MAQFHRYTVQVPREVSRALRVKANGGKEISGRDPLAGAQLREREVNTVKIIRTDLQWHVIRAAEHIEDAVIIEVETVQLQLNQRGC